MSRFALGHAIADIGATFKEYDLIHMMGWQDIRTRYKRSVLGPFWLTISMGIMIMMLGFLFSKILNLPLHEFFPYLSVGMIVWGYISTSVTEGCQSFMAGQAIIKQLPLPLFLHVMRILWRNTIILAHNSIILPAVLLLTHLPITWSILLAIPGFFLLFINLTWIVWILAILCVRYRDLQPMIQSLLQIMFYVTPIIWMPGKLSGRTSLYFVETNPVYHIINLVRTPLLGACPSTLDWIVSSTCAVLGCAATLVIYSYTKQRIAYWL